MPREQTIDELASATGTTSRTIRSFQSQGLLDPPVLRGRTGYYGPGHAEILEAILRLQAQGFSLQSLQVLFGARRRGDSLADVLGLAAPPADTGPEEGDSAELYAFPDTVPATNRRPAAQPRLLSVVPTTVWSETRAS
jgi:DNA-binding transcriptional MerR regulator